MIRNDNALTHYWSSTYTGTPWWSSSTRSVWLFLSDDYKEKKTGSSLQQVRMRRCMWSRACRQRCHVWYHRDGNMPYLKILAGLNAGRRQAAVFTKCLTDKIDGIISEAIKSSSHSLGSSHNNNDDFFVLPLRNLRRVPPPMHANQMKLLGERRPPILLVQWRLANCCRFLTLSQNHRSESNPSICITGTVVLSGQSSCRVPLAHSFVVVLVWSFMDTARAYRLSAREKSWFIYVPLLLACHMI